MLPLGEGGGEGKNKHVSLDRTTISQTAPIPKPSLQPWVRRQAHTLYCYALNIAETIPGKRPLGSGRPLCLPIEGATTVGCPYAAGIPTTSADFNASQYSPEGRRGFPVSGYSACQKFCGNCGSPGAIGNYPGLAMRAGSDVGASGGRPLARRRRRNAGACAARPYRAVQ
jgi:hypothetical protein